MSDDAVNLNVNDIRDHQRWLIDNGFINDMHKDQLYLFGAMLHKQIQAVELDVDIEKKRINYKLFVPKGFFGTIAKFNKLSQSQGVWGLWRFRNMLQKEGNLDFTSVVNVFVKDYCGPKWAAKVSVLDIADYEDGYPVQGQEESSEPNKQPHD
jgi:hypothetical protein